MLEMPAKYGAQGIVIYYRIHQLVEILLFKGFYNIARSGARFARLHSFYLERVVSSLSNICTYAQVIA